MKKIFQNQAVAWVVLILAVALACVWGLSRKDVYESKKATELLDVKYGVWINDSAKLLSNTTKNTIEDYNTEWSQRYGGLVAVATVPTLNGWSNKENAGGEDYGRALGEKWGLGPYDMLLLLVKDEYWYLVYGDAVDETIGRNGMSNQITTATDAPYYKGNFDEAVVELFRKADVLYAQSAPIWANEATYTNENTDWDEHQQPAKTGHVSIFKVVLLIIAIFVVWAILDRIRYGRYRRRSVVHVGAPAVSYYPIFWGRPSRAAAPYAPPPPHHPGPVYHSPARPARPSGTYTFQKPGARTPTARPASRPTTPVRPNNTTKPGNSTRPGGFGKGSLGGGKR